MPVLSKIFGSIFKFLSSLKLAVITILSLAYVLAMGTIYESLYGAAVAKEKVYGTWWFTLVLFFLGVNVLCAALSRLPWKRHHIGFVITHAGIITILIGSVITQRYGVEGMLPLAEGEQADRMTLDDPLLQVAAPDLGTTSTWKARFSQNPPSPGKPWVKTLKDGTKISVDKFYLHSQENLQVKEGSAADSPALHVVLTGLPMGAGEEVSQWLFLKESEFSPQSVQMGPARISFLDESLLKKLSETPPDSKKAKIGIVKLEWGGGKKAEIDLTEALQKELPIPGSDLRFKLLRYLPDARVENNQLVSRSDEPRNPAVEFKILGKGVEEIHLAFANFPDLEGIHGNSQQKLGFKTLFLSERSVSSSSKAELFLAVNDQKEVFYRLRSKGVLSEVKRLNIGELLPTGWMTIQFKVAEFLPHAQTSLSYRKVNVPTGKDGPPPAIQVSVESRGKSASAWLQQGDVREVVLEGVPFLFRYGLRAHPLGFTIKLKKFEVGRYAGTNSPSSFESLVEIKNNKAGETFEEKIFMNNPLHYRGYTFFQASYQEGEGAPMISVFSIGRDPGTPIKYAGSILLVSGIAFMFWFKPLFVQKRMEARKMEKLVIETNQPSALHEKI